MKSRTVLLYIAKRIERLRFDPGTIVMPIGYSPKAGGAVSDIVSPVDGRETLDPCLHGFNVVWLPWFDG